MDIEQRYLDFARLGADWFWETDRADRFTYFSVVESQSGLDLTRFIGHTRRELTQTSPENLPRLEAIEAVVRTQQPFRNMIYRPGLEGGAARWCEISGEPKFDASGAFDGYRGVGRDITALMETQRELQAKSMALEAIMQATPDGIQLFDKNNVTLAINNQIYDILNAPRMKGAKGADPTYDLIRYLAARGEYGPGDPDAVARERIDRMHKQLTQQRQLSYERQLTTGRWIEVRVNALEDSGHLSLYRDITDIKEREAELERQAALMSTIVSTLDGFAVYDKDKRLAAWNDGFAELVGIDPSLLRHGATARELLIEQARSGEFGPCDPETEADRRLSVFYPTDRPVVIERTRPNGRVIELRRRSIPGGGWATTYVDVTARKQAEWALQELNTTLESRITERTAALAESERFLRTLLANVPGMVYRCSNDQARTMEFVSDGCQSLLGIAPTDLLDGSPTYGELIHPDDRDMVRKATRRGFSTALPFEVLYRVRRADGSWRLMWDRARAVPGMFGGGEKIEGILLDITEHKDTERELARVRDVIVDAIDSINNNMILWDRDDRLVLFTRHLFDQIQGAEKYFIVGRTFTEILTAAVEGGGLAVPPGETKEEFLAKRIAMHHAADGTIITRHSANQRILHISEHRTQSGGTVSVGVDVTERLKMEEQLREGQRMEAIRGLTGGLAHDLNNYLAAIMGNLDLLAERLHADTRATKWIKGALTGVQRSADLTRNLLAFSRSQRLDPRVLDIGEAIGDVTRLLRRTIGEKIEVDLDVAADLWPVRIDATQLNVAIVNLANNARDAMPNGGVLKIAVRNVPAGTADKGRGDQVLIEVSDTGAGMETMVLAKAFEPFFSTKGPSHGTGLGLSIVHGFVHQSGGTITLSSAVGKGTTVRIFLPRMARDALRPAAATAGLELPRGTENILIVEDNEEVRAATGEQLGSLGYRFTALATGDAAVEILQARASEFDLVLSDVVVAGNVDGLALARMVSERWPSLRVVLTTGSVGDAGTLPGTAAAKEFTMLRKPYGRAELARSVRAALGA
jgi:PAS domain S-box-containing protein